MTTKYTLVTNDGLFPRNSARASLTANLKDAIVYDERDNPELKLPFWSALFPSKQFAILELP